MALLDFLKNKKERDKTIKVVEKKPRTSVTPKAATAVGGVPSEGGKKAFSYSVIKEPHISEKASNLAEDNKYTFKVETNSNKLEIKKSVEGIYNVNVLGVHIIKSPKKKRRIGRTEGFKKAFTKAVVTIKEGQKIEIL